MVPLPSQRHLFDIPDDVAFLNCAYMSPLTRASVMACERGLRRKLHPWNIAPADFFTASEAVRGLFAQLINKKTYRTEAGYTQMNVVFQEAPRALSRKATYVGFDLFAVTLHEAVGRGGHS
jgi:hypothetical protein